MKIKYTTIAAGLLFFMMIYSCNPKKQHAALSDTPVDTASILASASALYEKARSMYSSDPDDAVEYFEEAANLYNGLDNTKRAYCLQSIAFAYDEKMGKHKKAIPYAQQALDIWKVTGSQIEEANMLKYIGYLNGCIGNFSEGKQQINDAIRLFTQLGYKQGEAVSLKNLAKVYELEKKYDSCLIYAIQAKDIWKQYYDCERLLNVNNLIISTYMKMDDFQNAITCVDESESLPCDGAKNDIKELRRLYTELVKEQSK